jgi:MoaA/NifB/PqqE/SkfB family radical SAM enzyme
MGRITDIYVQNQKFARPNLDISHRCILKCPQCIRQKSESQDQIKRSFDLEEEDFVKILNYYDNGITFCGQISDPIYHPNFLNFLKLCNGRGRAIRIATNGSGKSLEWWNEAYSYGKGENAWYFGVDGIDEKSELYRVGSDFKNVWEMMRLGKKLGHVIVWQFIIFGYNEHEVERAKEIAADEGFALLFINTNRGFNPNSLRLRKNLDFTLSSPATKSRTVNVKKEFFGNHTPEFDQWHERRIKLINK